MATALPVKFDLLDKPRTLKYDVNALADIENTIELGIGEMFSQKRIGFSAIRALVFGGLKHEDRGLNVTKVGNMIQRFLEKGGSLEELMVPVNAALKASGLFKEDATESEEASADPSPAADAKNENA